MEIVVYSHPVIREELLRAYQCDIVITNCDLPAIEGVFIYHLGGQLFSRDLSRLTNQLLLMLETGALSPGEGS